MTTENFDETAAIDAARRGDRRAFGLLVKAYQRRAYAAAYGFVRNREDALDLAQEAFVRAFRAMRHFKPEMPFYPWLYQIIRNTCLNHIKRKKRRGEHSLEAMREEGFDFAEDAIDPMEAAERADVKEALLKAIDTLPPQHREILQLRHFQELSYTEIAECLQIPQGTVMSRLHAARKGLREVLQQEEKRLVNV